MVIAGNFCHLTLDRGLFMVQNDLAQQMNLIIFFFRVEWRLAFVFYGLSKPTQHSSAGEGSTCNVGDLSSIPGLGRSPGEENGYPLQWFDLENSMDCIVHGVAKSQTEQLSLSPKAEVTQQACVVWPTEEASSLESRDLVLSP